MSETIETLDGTQIGLLDRTDKTYTEATQELERAFTSVVTRFPHLREADLLIGMAFELLHWMYAPAGAHGTPAEIFERGFREVIAQSAITSRRKYDDKVDD